MWQDDAPSLSGTRRAPSAGALPLTASDVHSLLTSPHTMVLDIRSFLAFRKCHIASALNVGLPVALARRTAITVAMMATTLCGDDRAAFDRRAGCDVIVYDAASATPDDSALLRAVMNCLDAEGLVHATYFLVGGFDRFAERYPASLARGNDIGLSREPCEFAAAAAAARRDAAISATSRDALAEGLPPGLNGAVAPATTAAAAAPPAPIAIPISSPAASPGSSTVESPRIRRVHAPPLRASLHAPPPLQLHQNRVQAVIASSYHPRASPRSALPISTVTQPAASLSALLLPPVADPPTRILDGLYVGDVRFALDLAALRRARIRFIVNVTVECPNAFEGLGEFAYHRLPLKDTPSQQCQLAALLDTFVFMDAALTSGRGRVLLHCAAGRSRSVTVAIAYMVYRFGLSVDDAYRFMQARRANICPNLGFMGILLALQPTLNAFPHVSIEQATAELRSEDGPLATTSAAPQVPAPMLTPSTGSSSGQRPHVTRMSSAVGALQHMLTSPGQGIVRTSTSSEFVPTARVRRAQRAKAVSCPTAAMVAAESASSKAGQFIRSRSLSNSHLLMLHQPLTACSVD